MYRGKGLAAGHHSCQLRAEPKVSGCNALLPEFSLHRYCTAGILENVLQECLLCILKKEMPRSAHQPDFYAVVKPNPAACYFTCSYSLVFLSLRIPR
jgi:hypothetical protein